MIQKGVEILEQDTTATALVLNIKHDIGHAECGVAKEYLIY
jgi:hypothetical protein